MPGGVESDVAGSEAVFEQPGEKLPRAHGMPPRLDRFARGIDVRRILEGPLMGALVRVCAGVGPVLIRSTFAGPRQPSRRPAQR